jgi:2-keto-4-pentenoate hydratase/2-oxohepta-3-ene-1,7-dioic acid hydratase in catechol pathway
MRLATLKTDGIETACLQTLSGFLPLIEINARLGTSWSTDILQLINSGTLDDMIEWFVEAKADLTGFARSTISEAAAQFAPLYRQPRKIWGIGLNYREHAADLDESTPTGEPASFMKPDTSIVGPGDTIEIPRQSEKTTSEAELGLLFEEKCRDVSRQDWRSVIAGFTTILDMTAEDILRRNPRNLTQSKSFDTFFSFGPVLVTTDKIVDAMALKVRTVINGRIHAENVVNNMTFRPDFLVEYHTAIWTALPGDIISTGTPGAAHISDGDIVECQIDGFATLINRVKDLKVACD